MKLKFAENLSYEVSVVVVAEQSGSGDAAAGSADPAAGSGEPAPDGDGAAGSADPAVDGS